MTCAGCGRELPSLQGPCPACGAKVPLPPGLARAAPGPECPKCRAAVAPGEKFCFACGTEVKSSAQRTLERVERADHQQKIGRARGWLLAVSILTLATGAGFYFIQKSEVEDQIAKAEKQMAGIPPADRDARLKAAIGMTWVEAMAHDRGMVNLLLFVNLGLSVIYFGLWIWAKNNVFAASIIALILFLTVIVVSAILEPKTLAQGWIVKIFFTAALAKAIQAAYKERTLYGARG